MPVGPKGQAQVLGRGLVGSAGELAALPLEGVGHLPEEVVDEAAGLLHRLPGLVDEAGLDVEEPVADVAGVQRPGQRVSTRGDRGIGGRSDVGRGGAG